MEKLEMSRGGKFIKTDAKYTLSTISLYNGEVYDAAMKHMSSKSKRM